MNIVDETLTDYSFLSRYHYTKSKNYLKRRYRIRHLIPMFIGTPCIKRAWLHNGFPIKNMTCMATFNCSEFYSDLEIKFNGLS